MKLTTTLEDEILIEEKYRLTPNELMFIKTLFIFQEEDDSDLFGKYIKVLKNCGINLRDIIVSLQDKGIILKSYTIKSSGSEFNPLEIPFNKNFIKNLYKCSFEMGKELFEEYPQFNTLSNGNMVTLRGVSKHFDSLEQAYFKYCKYINWNVEKHNHIIELVKWGKEHNIIVQSLSSFIINNAWLDLEAIRNGDNVNYNPDAVKMI